MSSVPSLAGRFGRVLALTRTQVLGSTALALVIIAPTQSSSLLGRLGLPPDIVAASKIQFHAKFSSLLSSNIVSQLALITFWAIVGLVTYLICWGAYNLLVEARNEVTLSTAYTNRGHWNGPHGTLALKAVSALGLALLLAGLPDGIAFWITLAARFTAAPGLATAIWCALGIFGLAAQLYLVFVFSQLTFTPWYRAIDQEETFTQS